MLSRNDHYGYDVAFKLSRSIELADGSVYPILRRLKQEGRVTSYLEEASGGPPRKYYAITRDGEDMLSELKDEWITLTESVNEIIDNGGYEDEQE
jgi:PadR family transcriptional regulator PadR